MPIELRIQSGSRAGQVQSFDKSVVAIGRHPMSDLRFDPHIDIDVSTRHGEIRHLDDRYVVLDNNSTNGTYVNGERMLPGGSRELHSGDILGFGHSGPKAVVAISAEAAPSLGSSASAPSAPGAPRRVGTGERVAAAVRQQTRMLKLAMSIGVVVLIAVAGGLYWVGHREAQQSEDRLRAATTSYEESSKQLQAQLQQTNDTALINTLTRQRDSLVRIAQSAHGDQAAVVQAALLQHQTMTRALDQMNLPAVRDANNKAVVLIHSDMGTARIEATGFGVTAKGGVITNRHVVIDSAGNHSKRIVIKFADTDTWHAAHIVRSFPTGGPDLALLQIDDAGDYRAVKGISPTVSVAVGGTIASLGYPLGSDTPMDGAVASTTLTPGTVSKSIPDVLQIASFATHGSSGSPVFDSHGDVVGVIYAGPKEAQGRIVYAVPSPHIIALLNSR
ncbi:MAG TPA: trypsin-like peptidase domain-containing protein [Gemmatimonadaceae bacterium]|jgi:S1-C subfamily serine protease